MRTLQKSFAGGVLTPELYGRLDLTKFTTGLAVADNFLILPHGPAANRPGFKYLGAVKTAAKATRLIPFSYSTTQTYVLEFGDLYMRIFTQGGQLLTGTVTAYSGGTAYTPGDIASSGGTNYICIASTTGNAPPNAFYWYALTSTIVEIPTLYAEADLFDLHFVQSADVLTIVHPSYAPREIVRGGATKWYSRVITFAPTVTAPTGVAVSASPASGSTVNRYVVTAVASDGQDESVAGPEGSATGVAISGITKANPGVLTTATHGLAVNDLVYVSGIGGMVEITNGYYYVNTVPLTTTLTLKTLTGAVIDTTSYTAYTSGGTVKKCAVAVTNDLSVAGNKNTITWTAVSGAVRYNVYKQKNEALYGYIGQSSITSFVDQNIIADISITPPEAQNPFSGSNNYPQAVSYFEQRRVFAGTNNKPQTMWLTRSATESNLNYSIPTQDSDAMVIKIAAREANTIRHLVPLGDLILLTSGGEWKCSSGSADALTPVTIQIKPQSYMGASNVQPVVTGNTIIYSQDRSAGVREVSYSWEAQSYKTNDMSIMVPHYLDGFEIVDMAFMRAPYQVLWVVRDDGVLLGMTYIPEQQVIAWHRHYTDGFVESVAVIAEGNEDVLYAVIRRTINGSSVRYVEQLASRQFNRQQDAFFVDCGATLNNTVAKALTPGTGATVAGTTGVTFTAGAAYWSAGDVGKRIHYDYETVEEGATVYSRASAVITGYTSTTVVTATIEEAFPNTTAIAPGGWRITTTSVSGLSHLEGEDVMVLADGAVISNLTVTSGAITLPAGASVVHVGLPITAKLQTLPIALEMQGFGQGRAKNVSTAFMRVYRSSGIFAGPSEDRLVEYKQRTAETYGSPPELKSDEIEMVLSPAWSRGGQIIVKHTDPLPLTVVSLSFDVAVGG